ncbi:MAG TPA: NAD(P)H-hydrate dehydratase [Anaerohalosphaeraceae bacterium]|mgnify:CR=1 FL=1|nr:NAD(P)H-hydrate dehydratase [Anaerohalosphaeraceae bacterium]HQG05184.1 NAD(P)H-hydrate dehydratase [Anaerohalosphaeraceae bacterium]HQI06902.1 NAD(P)H-hydrate dehydratase [Anaerohalosphaeraceae bacterium]HQJ66598.1 NAD(P)H-hydrate dehydratase [Anaerohalosphaeraceae bacterium]
MKQIKQIPSLVPRPRDSHKGTFGKVLVIGGSAGYSGAPTLAAKAAFRSGAGLVRVAVPRCIQPIVAASELCCTTAVLPEDPAGRMDCSAVSTATALAEENDVICFGPGAGTGPGTREVLIHLLSRPNLRLIIDADGLNVLAAAGSWPDRTKASFILTPHPGEFARLWKGLMRESIPEERIEQASRMAQRVRGVVVLKGANTVVADSEQFYINSTGNPGMATAGSGDVLSGVITSLAGQGLANFEAAVLGVYVHGLAGDIAAQLKGEISMTAMDIIDYLPAAFLRLHQMGSS